MKPPQALIPVVFKLLERDKDELVPIALQGKFPSNAFRLTDYVSIAFFDAELEALTQFVGQYEGEVAIGVDQIWKQVPISRGYFVAEIDRPSGGSTATMFIPLSECLYGDQFASPRLYLPFNRHLGPIPNFEPNLHQSIELSSVDLGEFSYLATYQPRMIDSLGLNYEIFCVSGFSTDLPPEALSELNLSLIPSPQLDALKEQVTSSLEAKSSTHVISRMNLDIQQIFPAKTSLAFLFKDSLRGQHDFNLAIVSRVLSASALNGSVWGKILTCWGSEQGTSFSFESFGDARNARSYTLGNAERRLHVSHADETFKKCIGLVNRSNAAKFASGREDYRLRALDTVEDSGKSGVAAMAVLQIWMGIECLVSEKSEVTQSISLALSAYWPASHRKDIFTVIKKAYNFRSQVAHGYAFPRDRIFHHMNFVGPLFHRLFTSSLQYDSSDEFKLALREHVLAGMRQPFDLHSKEE